ncbi:MAG: tannase/feruloyl esterase family alpha/beta hydrolase [Pseudomonadota bacterium]
MKHNTKWQFNRWRASLWVCLASFFGIVHADPFANAGKGVVDYGSTTHSAKLRCKDLIAAGNFEFSIISARVIPATAQIPEHCRLDGVIPSEIRFEINLPLAWNGRLYMYGNGGLAGTPAIDPGKQAARDQALTHGFGTAYTDTGHDRRIEPGGTFAHDNFHKLVDYGFRAVHLTITSAKQIATLFYGAPAKTSYWNGCSTGGRQAMISAQRFPQDFDGIIAGAPAADYSGLKFSQAWRVSAISKADFTEAEALELARHIYQACDDRDGIADGLIADPRRCSFDPEKDLPKCVGKDTVECFDAKEINALNVYYAPVRLADKVVYPAMPVGSEVLGYTYDGTLRTGWYPWLINPDGPVLLDLLGSDFFRYMVFINDDPTFDWTEFDFASEPDNLAEFRDVVDAIDPDLTAFNKRGGKLLSYFGWADPDINPLTLLDYHAQVATLDPQLDDYFRVFMIPGMFHCRGGPGPDRFDAMTALIDWVEADRAPETLPLWQHSPGDTRRINTAISCAHPREARRVNASWQCLSP